IDAQLSRWRPRVLRSIGLLFPKSRFEGRRLVALFRGGGHRACIGEFARNEWGRDRRNSDGKQKTGNHADLWPPGHRRSFWPQVPREPLWHAAFLHGRRCRGRRWLEVECLSKFLDFLNTFLDTAFVAHPFRSVEQETKVSIHRSTHGAPPKERVPRHSPKGNEPGVMAMLGIGKRFQQLPCLTPRPLSQSCGTAGKKSRRNRVGQGVSSYLVLCPHERNTFFKWTINTDDAEHSTARAIRTRWVITH